MCLHLLLEVFPWLLFFVVVVGFVIVAVAAVVVPAAAFLLWYHWTRNHSNLVAEWIHFTLWGIILPTIKLKVYTF